MAAVFVMARWWGQFHSPRAPHPLRQPADAIARTAWFITGAGAAAIVMAGEWAADPLWLHLIIELAPFLAVQFTLSVLAWQFTEHRRRELDDHAQVLER